MTETDGTAVAADWAAIRAAYTSGEPAPVLAARFDVPQPEIAERVRLQNWRKRGRKRADQRQDILDAMFRIFERQMTDFEIRVVMATQQSDRETDMASRDKEMAALANMAKTFEKLLEMDKTEPAEYGEMSDKETEEIRAKLAKRIEQYLAR